MTDLTILFRGDAVRLVKRSNGATFGPRTRIAHVYSIYDKDDETLVMLRMRDGTLRSVHPWQIVKIRDGNGLLPDEQMPLLDWRADPHDEYAYLDEPTPRDVIAERSSRKNFKLGQEKRRAE